MSQSSSNSERVTHAARLESATDELDPARGLLSVAAVNRTIVYATLTAVLAAAYFGLSVGLGTLVPLSEGSPLVVAFSTLVVVALFRPLRERIQSLIDQRFYRSKYNAALVVEGFGTRLRHGTDLNAPTTDLCGVVFEAIRPAHVSLWTPTEAESGRESASAPPHNLSQSAQDNSGEEMQPRDHAAELDSFLDQASYLLTSARTSGLAEAGELRAVLKRLREVIGAADALASSAEAERRSED